jgi:hypothetical protein
MITGLINNIRKHLTPDNAASTARSAQRLFKQLSNGEADAQQLRLATRLSSSVREAAGNDGAVAQLTQFIDDGGRVFLNGRSRTALNQAANSAITGRTKQAFLSSTQPEVAQEVTRTVTKSGRQTEIESLHDQAKLFVQDTQKSNRYTQHIANLRSRLSNDQRTRANELANQVIPDATLAVRDANLAYNSDKSDAKIEALEQAQKVLRQHREELNKLDAQGRKQFERTNTEDLEELNFANQFRINQRRSQNGWLNSRLDALDKAENPTGGTPRNRDTLLADRQHRLANTDRLDTANDELNRFRYQLNEAAKSNPNGRIITGDLNIPDTRLAHWQTTLDNSLRSGLQREDGSAVEVDDLQRLQESVAGLRRLRDKHGRIDESIPLDNVVPQGLKLTNPDGSDMTAEQLRSRIASIQDGLERLNVGGNHSTLQNLTPKAGAFSGIGWPNQLNAKTIGLTALGTGAAVYGQDQVRDHMDNSRAQSQLQQISTRPADQLNDPTTLRDLRTILTQQTDAAIPILGGRNIGDVSNVSRNGNRVQFQAVVDNKPTWFVIGDNGVLVNHTRYNDLVSTGKSQEQALKEASVFGNGQGNALLSNPLRQTPNGEFGINYNGYLNLALGPNVMGINDTGGLAQQRFQPLTDQNLRNELARQAVGQQTTGGSQFLFNGWAARNSNDQTIITTRMNPNGSMTVFRRNPDDPAAAEEQVAKEQVATYLTELAKTRLVVKTQPAA